MGRTRSFDEADIVALAARQFLATGYEATSIDDLVAVTGLHRGSLYTAFGSKRGLFLAALTQAADASATDDRPATLDLTLVALLELAPTDAEVRGLAESLVARLTGGDPAILGARLLERAGIPTPESRKDRA